MTARTELSYATLIVADPTASAARYGAALGLGAGPTSSPATFRRLLTPGADLAFSDPPVRSLLDLPSDVGAFLTFDPGSPEAVALRSQALVRQGATELQPAHETRYGTVLAVLRDPDGHVVRLENRIRPLPS